MFCMDQLVTLGLLCMPLQHPKLFTMFLVLLQVPRLFFPLSCLICFLLAQFLRNYAAQCVDFISDKESDM